MSYNCSYKKTHITGFKAKLWCRWSLNSWLLPPQLSFPCSSYDFTPFCSLNWAPCWLCLKKSKPRYYSQENGKKTTKSKTTGWMWTDTRYKLSVLLRKQEFERKAQRLYKKKKTKMFKILSKKTKKGQPNLHLQMENLLKTYFKTLNQIFCVYSRVKQPAVCWVLWYM